MRKKLNKNKSYYTNAKSRKKRVLFWNVLTAVICSIIILTAIVYNLNKEEVQEAKAYDIDYGTCSFYADLCIGGSLDFNLTNPKGYVEYKLWEAGLKDETEFVFKLIDCESKWQVDAIGVNSNGTVDTGIWQRNSIHIKELSNADSFDWKKATDWAIAKRLRDGGWGAWSCNNKIY